MAAVALGLLLSACRQGGEAEGAGSGEVSLSAPRVPDDEGVATAVSAERLELDGARRYPVDEGIRSFSTYHPGQIEPMANRQGQYVQIGLRDGKVVWMAGFGVVVPGDPPSTFFSGRFRSMDEGRALFDGGTVLTLADGVTPPPPGASVQARIDVRAHRVTEFVGA